MVRKGLVAVDINGRPDLLDDLADTDPVAAKFAFFIVKKIVHFVFVEISSSHRHTSQGFFPFRDLLLHTCRMRAADRLFTAHRIFRIEQVVDVRSEL